jgi:membrane dipeptidase
MVTLVRVLFCSPCSYLMLLSDLPILARFGYANNVSAIDLESPMPGQVDIPRLRAGKVGGFFW